MPGFVYYFLSVMMSSDNTGVQIAYVAAYNQSTIGRFAVRTYINNQWYDWLYFDSNISLDKKLNNYAKNEMIPYLFQYTTAKQPLFLISENSQDTMYCNSRGCRRNSSAKALLFKVMSSLADELKGNNVSTGYGIISYSDDDAGCTALTDYGEISISHRRTPKGHVISFGYMYNEWIANTGLPVAATINGETHTLESCAIYRLEAESYSFILSMADLYLF